jgi:hypothetical protein
MGTFSPFAIELSKEQSIAILEKTKQILGPNGEHWTKGCWFGKTFNDMEPEYDEDTGEMVNTRSLLESQADQANAWCIMGAVEEAAYQLGLIESRMATDRLSSPISLQNLVSSKEEWEDWTVIDVNDNENTTFDDVKALIDERLAELRS